MTGNKPASSEQLHRLIEVATQTTTLCDISLTNIRQWRMGLASNDPVPHEDIVNALDFTLLVQRDLAYLLIDLARYSGANGAEFYARMALLLIHEASESFRKVISRRAQLIFSEIMGEEAATEIRALHSRLSKLAERAHRDFGDIRNGLAAHLEVDFGTRNELAQTVRVPEVLDIVIEMLAALRDLARILNSYLQLPK